jgi:hypothetical protein
MCTAVVGGSIQRAATRISTASDQRNATPMSSHRTTDRSEPLRSGVGCVSGFSATFQNNRLDRIDLVPDELHYRITSSSTDALYATLPRMPRYSDWPVWLQMLVMFPHGVLVFVLAYLWFPRSDEGRRLGLFLLLYLVAFCLVMHYVFHCQLGGSNS